MDGVSLQHAAKPLHACQTNALANSLQLLVWTQEEEPEEGVFNSHLVQPESFTINGYQLCLI